MIFHVFESYNGANEDPATLLQLQPREINRNYIHIFGSFSGNQGNKMLCAFFLLSKSIQIKIDFAKTYRNLGVAPNRFLPAFTNSRSIIRSIFGHEKSHHLPKKTRHMWPSSPNPLFFYQRQMKEIEGYKLVHPKKSYKVPYILLWIQADFTTNSYIICSPFFRFLGVWNKHKQTIHINSNALENLFSYLDSTTGPNPESWCHLVASSHHWANYKKCEPPAPHDQWIPGNQKNGSTSPNCECTQLTSFMMMSDSPMYCGSILLLAYCCIHKSNKQLNWKQRFHDIFTPVELRLVFKKASEVNLRNGNWYHDHPELKHSCGFNLTRFESW